MKDETDHHSHENGDSPESPYAKSRTGSGNSDNNNNNNSHSHHHNKEQDRFLPIANVGRIMKKVIPGNGKISKDAKETVQECVSEFISFVTGEASDRCQRDKRKTINGDDILGAIMILGFEDYVMPLTTYLKKYREIEGDKPTVPKQRTHLQQQHQHPHQQLQQVKEEDIKPTNICFNNVYSSTNGYEMEPRDIKNLMPRPSSFLAADQPFSIPNFSPNSIHKQLQAQDQVDSVVHW